MHFTLSPKHSTAPRVDAHLVVVGFRQKQGTIQMLGEGVHLSNTAAQYSKAEMSKETHVYVYIYIY